MKCDSCGGDASDWVASCPFCGTSLRSPDSFEAEVRGLLTALEDRLVREVSRRTDGGLFAWFIAWLGTGPATYLVLGRLTEIGAAGRLAFALLVLVPGFIAFGMRVQASQDAAEAAIWLESVRPELDGLMGRTGLSPSELLLMAGRVLPPDSRVTRRLVGGP